MTIKNKIFTFLTIAFSTLSYSTYVLSTQVDNLQASSTGFAGTVVGIANHSDKTKLFTM